MRDRKITVAGLANELGVSKAAVSNLRGDAMPKIGSERVNQIIVALNCLLKPGEKPIGAADLLGFGLTVEEMQYVQERQIENSKIKRKPRGRPRI
ncbi:MAG: helix-turn-helix domain-containing protein [Acaryochloris sp. RU_4_1]|nr:helix-turn-helix domain-containing protein [Acaryochloris sp. RU_4_1]NJN39477.1 helix-turn-helix domain-containing protein [Acaryochloridaceae cyanobacterium CSU_3_4]